MASNHTATALKIRQGEMKLKDVPKTDFLDVRRALRDDRALAALARELGAAKRGSRFDGQPKPGPTRVRV